MQICIYNTQTHQTLPVQKAERHLYRRAAMVGSPSSSHDLVLSSLYKMFSGNNPHQIFPPKDVPTHRGPFDNGLCIIRIQYER